MAHVSVGMPFVSSDWQLLKGGMQPTYPCIHLLYLHARAFAQNSHLINTEHH